MNRPEVPFLQANGRVVDAAIATEGTPVDKVLCSTSSLISFVRLGVPVAETF